MVSISLIGPCYHLHGLYQHFQTPDHMDYGITSLIWERIYYLTLLPYLPFTNPAMSQNSIMAGIILLDPYIVANFFQPIVRYFHYPNVRFDGTEGIVGGLSSSFRIALNKVLLYLHLQSYYSKFHLFFPFYIINYLITYFSTIIYYTILIRSCKRNKIFRQLGGIILID